MENTLNFYRETDLLKELHEEVNKISKEILDHFQKNGYYKSPELTNKAHEVLKKGKDIDPKIGKKGGIWTQIKYYLHCTKEKPAIDFNYSAKALILLSVYNNKLGVENEYDSETKRKLLTDFNNWDETYNKNRYYRKFRRPCTDLAYVQVWMMNKFAEDIVDNKFHTNYISRAISGLRPVSVISKYNPEDSIEDFLGLREEMETILQSNNYEEILSFFTKLAKEREDMEAKKLEHYEKNIKPLEIFRNKILIPAIRKEVEKIKHPRNVYATIYDKRDEERIIYLVCSHIADNHQKLGGVFIEGNTPETINVMLDFDYVEYNLAQHKYDISSRLCHLSHIFYPEEEVYQLHIDNEEQLVYYITEILGYPKEHFKNFGKYFEQTWRDNIQKPCSINRPLSICKFKMRNMVMELIVTNTENGSYYEKYLEEYLDKKIKETQDHDFSIFEYQKLKEEFFAIDFEEIERQKQKIIEEEEAIKRAKAEIEYIETEKICKETYQELIKGTKEEGLNFLADKVFSGNFSQFRTLYINKNRKNELHRETSILLMGEYCPELIKEYEEMEDYIHPYYTPFLSRLIKENPFIKLETLAKALKMGYKYVMLSNGQFTQNDTSIGFESYRAFETMATFVYYETQQKESCKEYCHYNLVMKKLIRDILVEKPKFARAFMVYQQKPDMELLNFYRQRFENTEEAKQIENFMTREIPKIYENYPVNLLIGLKIPILKNSLVDLIQFEDNELAETETEEDIVAHIERISGYLETYKKRIKINSELILDIPEEELVYLNPNIYSVTVERYREIKEMQSQIAQAQFQTLNPKQTEQQSTEITAQQSAEVTTQQSTEVTNQQSVEVTNQQSVEVTTQQSAEVITPKSVEVTTQQSVEVTNQQSVEVMTKQSTEENNEVVLKGTKTNTVKLTIVEKGIVYPHQNKKLTNEEIIELIVDHRLSYIKDYRNLPEIVKGTKYGDWAVTFCELKEFKGTMVRILPEDYDIYHIEDHFILSDIEEYPLLHITEKTPDFFIRNSDFQHLSWFLGFQIDHLFETYEKEGKQTIINPIDGKMKLLNNNATCLFGISGNTYEDPKDFFMKESSELLSLIQPSSLDRVTKGMTPEILLAS